MPKLKEYKSMNAQDYFKNEDAIKMKVLSKHCCRKPTFLNCENKFIKIVKNLRTKQRQ